MKGIELKIAIKSITSLKNDEFVRMYKELGISDDPIYASHKFEICQSNFIYWINCLHDFELDKILNWIKWIK